MHIYPSIYIFFTTVALQNEKYAGMGHCIFTFTFMSSLPCLSFFGMLSLHLFSFLMICLFLYDFGFIMKQFAIQFQKLATFNYEIVSHYTSGLAQSIVLSSSIVNSTLCFTELGADSGLGSALSSRCQSSESVFLVKKHSLKRTRSHGLDLDTEPSVEHHSQPNLQNTSHEAGPGHKENLLHDQVLSKLTSIQVST